MTDQATELRRMAAVAAGPRPQRSARVIAVTSGKGGVGKTSIAVNLGIALAQAGRRVALLDGDWGLSNAEMLLGLTPRHDLRHVLRGECALSDILLDGPGGLTLIPGASGVSELANMARAERERLLEALAELDGRADIILLDTAPGISDAVVDLALMADEILVVSTPQPTSLADAYASAKVILARRPGAAVGLVLNMVSGSAQAREVGAGFSAVTERFLGCAVPLRGFVPQDPGVADAVTCQRPFLLARPRPAARAVRELAGELAAAFPAPNADGRGGAFEAFRARLRVSLGPSV